MALANTPKIYVRLGFSDLVVPILDRNKPITETPESYLIGYELEDGTECEEDGTPLDYVDSVAEAASMLYGVDNDQDSIEDTEGGHQRNNK